MAIFKVIKAHDGLQLGDLKVLEPSPLTDYMIENGYWEEVSAPETETKKVTVTVAVKPKKKSK